MRNYLLPDRRTGWLLAALPLIGLALNFAVQAAALDLQIFRVLDWISRYYWLYLIGGLVFFCLMLAVVSLVRNLYLGTLIVLVAGTLIAATDYKKLATTGEPLFPWDLMLLKNAGEMGNITQGMVSPYLIAAAAIGIAVLAWLSFRLPKARLPIGLRVVCLAVSIAAIAGFVQLVGGNQSKLLAAVDYQNIFWNQKVNYTQNGFVFAFAGNLKQDLIDKPEGYSKEAVDAIARKYRDANAGDQPTAGSTQEQPNILFIMDEAFFDATRLPGLTFGEDPLSFLHGEAAAAPSGYLLSPEFGGNTANVEFEALTGLSMYFLKDGSIPYQQKIVKLSSLPSLVSLLKDRGYAALALHPYDKTFYNRNRVYPILGFDKFTSETEMPQPERITPNGYISDLSAMKEAVGELQAADKPTFLHLVTMQNHFPFAKGLNGPNTVTVQGEPAERKDELETYVQDTKLTDAALRYLADAIKDIKRPTVVVFWGDHLPALSSDIYTAAGWDDDAREKHETPLLFMANFDIGAKPVGTLSPAFIGPTVFQLTNQPMPPYYNLLAKVRAELPGLSKNVLIGADNNVTALTDGQQKLLDDYRMIEYDLLEGKGYSQELLFD